MTQLHRLALTVAVFGAFIAGSVQAAPDDTACMACHSSISKAHSGAVHKDIGCVSCHTSSKEHLTDPKKHPSSPFDPKACGACHQEQYKSAFTMSDKPIRKSKKAADGPAPDPFFDRALGAHGFTKEHDIPRGHGMMAIDQFIVDRAFGGRFEPKDGWLYSTLPGGKSYKVWDVLKDNHPETNEQKVFEPGTAKAANAVCWTCKTTDPMLGWAYLGDDVKGATFNRASNPVELVRTVNHGFNCNLCHDPHTGKERIVRDALIDAMTRPGDWNVYNKFAKNPTKLDVEDVNTRGFTRKVAYPEKKDSRLLCAQCHVEYICNSGIDSRTGKPIGFDSHLTNHFPWVNADQIEAYYDEIGFRDFKHNRTGALLVKMQHPDSETFFGSTHDKAGATCQTCHMPKVTDEKGKTYTLHWATSPKEYVKETCLSCHKDKTEKQMVTAIDTMKNHFDGKVREAEARMNDMFNAFDQAQAVGVDESVLEQARKLHASAHINWEYWTAVNGAYFHNHEMAMRSLAKSVKASTEAANLLRKAAAEKVKANEEAAKQAPAASAK